MAAKILEFKNMWVGFSYVHLNNGDQRVGFQTLDVAYFGYKASGNCEDYYI